jgi:hypothetical protein
VSLTSADDLPVMVSKAIQVQIEARDYQRHLSQIGVISQGKDMISRKIVAFVQQSSCGSRNLTDSFTKHPASVLQGFANFCPSLGHKEID